MHSDVKVVKKDIKNITLKVKPTGEVILTIPLLVTQDHVEYILKKREEWISKKREFFKANNRVYIKEYVSGENCKYLGKNYRLKVIEDELENVKLQRGYIQLFVKDKTNLEKKKSLLENWYRKKAKNYFDKVIAKYAKIINRDISNVRIRQMKTRWGSCNPSKGYINLNSELIKKPSICIEYVIFHELTHLIHPNHSKKFYNYLDTYMPDWRYRKDRLEKF